jgi:predicted nucleic acid-binding protein
MALLADTGVWSMAYRRDHPRVTPEVATLRRGLTGGERIATMGLVQLELLRGFVPAQARAVMLEDFEALEFIEPTREDYVAAAGLSNTCRANGVQLETVDSLIAQVCIANDLTLLTTDEDFRHASQHIPLRVWSP